MTALNFLTLAEARDALKARKISRASSLRAPISTPIEAGKGLNAFVTVTADRALEMAKASDARLAKGEGSTLEGLPLGIKDLYATKGVHTQACSHILDGFKPPYESTVTEHLWRDGAVMLGKLNMDEFAMGSSNETSYYGPVASPWLPPNWTEERARASLAADKEGLLTPGGSSGGSAAAVAAHLCLAATASDTGGSIRQPAAFTGTAGIKPTYGRCSRWGMVAFASSLDQAGPIARTVRDCAIMLGSMAGHDPKDSTCIDAPVPDYEAAIRRSVKGLTIGIPREYRLDGMSQEIEALWSRGAEWLKDAGAKIVDVSLAEHPTCASRLLYCRARGGVVATSRATTACATACANRAATSSISTSARALGALDAEVRRRLMIGTYVLSAGYYDAYYVRAQKIRTLIKRDFETAFANGVDAMLTPATPSAAFGIGEKGSDDPVEMYLNDVFTVTVNMAGLPGLVAPAGLSAEGLPLGLQLIGRPFDEETLFTLGQAIEDAAGRMTLPKAWWA